MCCALPLAWCGVALLAAIIATAVGTGPLRHAVGVRFDAPLLMALRAPDDLARPIGPAWLTHAFLAVTVLGGGLVRWMVGATGLAVLARARRPVAACWLATALVGAALISLALKAAVHRPRPQIVPHLTSASGSSFPSSHALISAALYLSIGLMIAQTQARRAARVAIMTAAVLLVFLIGASRIYLGVHWPSDVLAGWSIGATWALTVFVVQTAVASRPVVSRAPAAT